jgi:DNA-binding MarR family transcriptional regulator
VSHLEERGLVRRQIDPTDRRITRLAITADGTRTLAEMRSRKNAYLAERLAGFTAEERAVLAAAVPVLERLANEAGEPR